MDSWDDEFREPTEDERTARRCISVALAVTNARIPLSTSEIRREFYPGLTDASFRKAFLRDRGRLAVAGLSLVNGDKRDDEATWTVDANAAFVREGSLSARDALTLDFLLLPLASDPTFPYARDLRIALGKIDRSFDGSSNVVLPRDARRRNNHLTRLEGCHTARHAAQVSYQRANGTQLDRVLAPYGFFPLRGQTYMVAASQDETGAFLAPHTYNLARVLAVRELARVRFEVPVDFDVRDFVRLPFQLGETRYVATFLNPQTGGTREEDVADEDGACAWALAKGLMPTAPASLVDAWQERVAQAARGFDHER